jgi:hypothetical protein
VVLIDDHQRHETLGRIRHDDGDRPCIQIKHRQGIESVAVHADNILLVNVRRFAAMGELSKAALLGHVGEIHVSLGG